MKKTVVASYSLEGKLIKTYESAKEASRCLKVFPRTIDKAIRENKIIHDRHWKRMPIDDIKKSIEPYRKKTTIFSILPIAEIDENNIVINIYPSIKKASVANNTDPHTIRDNLNGKTKSAKGKRYRYLTEEEIEKNGYLKGIEKTLRNN